MAKGLGIFFHCLMKRKPTKPRKDFTRKRRKFSDLFCEAEGRTEFHDCAKFHKVGPGRNVNGRLKPWPMRPQAKEGLLLEGYQEQPLSSSLISGLLQGQQ